MINEERGKRAEGLRRPYAGDAERLTSRLLRRIGEDVLDHPLQDGQIVFHDRPNQIHFDSKVAVDEDIAPANGLGPYLLGMPLPEIDGQPAGSLAEDEEVVDDKRLHQLVILEGGAPARGVLLDVLDGFQDVLKTGAIVPHSITASARTFSRTRGRSPSRWRHRPGRPGPPGDP